VIIFVDLGPVPLRAAEPIRPPSQSGQNSYSVCAEPNNALTERVSAHEGRHASIGRVIPRIPFFKDNPKG